ncbi:hypothetical protein SPI_07939 [Niveomyces insectorum RCEF 264]|uniref:Uncharacterized protein n=1 Tax=Niveomyces insectorum RCEF 264 TaxID=1081102 RepID=A0A167P5Z9_9HYPO|nr:hypothetical protein SPI_07939 [Niveomyces insectorum RCEF 264]
MPSFKTVFLGLAVAASPAALAAVTPPTIFRTSKGEEVTVTLVTPDDFPNRVNLSDLVFVSPSHGNETASEPAARLSKRDELSCYIPQIAANVEDCNGICAFFNDYNLNVATIPPFDELNFSLGTCTFGVVNRTPCTKAQLYGFFTGYCNNMLGECVINGYDGYFDMESYGLSSALFGEAAAPAYSPLAC